MILGRLVFFALLNLGGWAVLRRLWPALPVRRAAIAWVALALLAGSGWGLPQLLGRELTSRLGFLITPLKAFGAFWIIAVLATVGLGGAFLAVRAIAALVLRRRARAPESDVDLGRRQFLGGVGRAVPVAAVVTSGGGLAGGIVSFTVKREEVRVAGLPSALEGFRIGQITDVHVGAFIDTDFVRRAVAAMNAEKVDLQVMTGDLIDDLTQLDGTIAALETCEARHGMYAILGNHEHWRGLGPITRAYRASAERGGPLRLLVDDSHAIEHEGARLRVVGVDFPMGMPGERTNLMRAMADAAFARCEPGETVLCLSHHPDFFPHAAERGAHLTLAGHTHGGQVAAFGISAFWFAYRHMLGRYERDGRHLYVSGGTGHWLPFRIGVPAEVTVLTLRRA